MLKLLALDTSTEACSAALYIDGEMIHRYEIAPRKHSNLLLPMVDSLINEAGISKRDLDAIAFARGPGSFMGVRIATGAAQGIAYALSLPVIPVSSLAAMALVCHDDVNASHVACAFDARMNEVYWACYEFNHLNLPVQVAEEKVLPPQQIELPDNNDNTWVAAGTGWGAYQSLMPEVVTHKVEKVFPECLPNATSVAKIALDKYGKGETVSPAEAIPVYIRNNVAKTTKEREQANRE